MIITIRRGGTNETLKLNSRVISMFLCVPVNNTFQRHILIVLKHLKVSSDLSSERVDSVPHYPPVKEFV